MLELRTGGEEKKGREREREREGRMREAISHSIPSEHIQNSDKLFYNESILHVWTPSMLPLS